jgi:hypothetical protein
MINKKWIIVPSLVVMVFLVTACNNKNVVKNIVSEDIKTEVAHTVNSIATTTDKQPDASQSGWKVYNNEKYKLSFSYPDYLKVISDKKEVIPYSSQNIWRLKMATSNVDKQIGTTSYISSLNMEIVEGVSDKNFEELKSDKKLGFGSTAVLDGEEDRITGSKSFFLQTWKIPGGLVSYTASTLLQPGIEFNVSVSGQYGQKNEIKQSMYKLLESFK